MERVRERECREVIEKKVKRVSGKRENHERSNKFKTRFEKCLKTKK